jgi:two-component system alkaline phosphatase synthesis response regulator PhoP
VDVHVANLRRKLSDDPANPRFIETVRSVGYRFGPRPG